MASLEQQSPQQVLRRTVRVAIFNGGSVAILSSLAGVFAFFGGDRFGSVICAMVAMIGLLELQGGRMLRQGNKRGLFALVASQLGILSLVMGFIVGAVASMGPDHVVARVPLHYVRTLINEAGMTPRAALDYCGLLLKVAYASIGVTALLYQGGMVFYYGRRQKLIEAAIAGSMVGS